MKRVAVAGVVVLMLVAGCEGSSSAEEEVVEVAERFASAINADDYATICNELITARLASRFRSATGNRRDCKHSSARADLLGNPALRGLTPSAVSARDSTATVRLNESPVYLKLKRTLADGWRITAVGESP